MQYILFMPMPIIWQQSNVIYENHNCKKTPTYGQDRKKKIDITFNSVESKQNLKI